MGIYGGAHNNYIGGFSTVGNVISGNHDLGVDFGASSGNSVSGNMIGTNAAGSAALANRGGGIRICNASANNTIGGSLVKTGNVISGNLAMGVGIYNTGSTGNSIIGNIIGLDAAAGFKIANGHRRRGDPGRRGHQLRPPQHHLRQQTLRRLNQRLGNHGETPWAAT